MNHPRAGVTRLRSAAGARKRRAVPRLVSRHPLAALLLLAGALRVAAAIGAGVHHPDEVFQYLEQAHRMVFGYGYVPWEYREGMRSWLVPWLLAGPMWLGAVLAPGTATAMLLPRVAVALATLGTVWGAWSLGLRVSRRHAVVAGCVTAIWFDGVYFAGHTLTETVAVAAAVPGVALLWRDHPEPVRAERTDAGTWPLPLAGALLALAALVRFQYGPPLALLVAWRCRLDRRAWGAVIAGAAPVLALSALIDAAMGMRPYAWALANYRRNVVENAAATYGVSGPLFYVAELRHWWGYALAPIGFLAILGGQRFPQLLAAAVLTVALHSAVGHKELRFVLLAMTLLVILAALGTATLVQVAERHRGAWTGLALAGWAGVSLTLALSGEMRFRWVEGRPALDAARIAARDPKLCGLAAFDLRYWQSGGWVTLGRDVPIYPVTARGELGVPAMDPATLARIAPAFDAILTTPAGEAAMPPGYTRIACRVPAAPLTSAAERAGRAICLYRRPGGCDPAVAAAWRLQ